MFKKMYLLCLSPLLYSPSVISATPSVETLSSDYKNISNQLYKNNLSRQTYDICRNRGTEKPGSGSYDKFTQRGTYYCACCGGDHALFSSEAKYDSGTGWPSFWAPLNDNSLIVQNDERIFSLLVGATNEVICGRCGSHLGHVFDDGPAEHGGKRYCMNSVALIFVPEGQAPKNAFKKED